MDYTKQLGINHLEQRLYVHWDITTMCEYKCSYCYAMKEYEGSWMRPGNWKKQQRVIDEISKSTLPVFLGLLGGEPTYHHKYFEMIQQIEDKILSKHKDSRLYITTNGAKSLNFFKNHKYNNKIRFLWSFHPEYMDDKAVVNFIDNIQGICKLGFKSRVNIMLHPAKKYWEMTKTLIYSLDILSKEYNIELHPHFIYSDPHTTVKYSKEFYKEFDFIKNYTNKEYLFFKDDEVTKYSDIEVFNQKINQFKGWNCWNNNYEINLNCEVQQFCFEDRKPLVKDYFKNINIIKPIKCPHNFCSCDGLLKIRKENCEV